MTALLTATSCSSDAIRTRSLLPVPTAGRSCIESWIKERGRNAKCPQCNAPTRSGDVRNVYASRVLAAVDTSERDAALHQLEVRHLSVACLSRVRGHS